MVVGCCARMLHRDRLPASGETRGSLDDEIGKPEVKNPDRLSKNVTIRNRYGRECQVLNILG